MEGAVHVVGNVNVCERVRRAAPASALAGLPGEPDPQPGLCFALPVRHLRNGDRTDHFRVHGFPFGWGDLAIARTFRFAVRPLPPHRANSLSLSRSPISEPQPA